MELEFKKITDLAVGEAVSGCYLLKTVSIETDKRGVQYLAGNLADKDSEIPLKMWDYSGAIGSENAGSIVFVDGIVGEYRGKRQLVLQSIRLALPLDKYDESLLIPTAAIDADAEMAYVEQTIESFADKDLRLVCKFALANSPEFKTLPAAKRMHHAAKSGLLQHTANMMRAADTLAGIYPDVNRDLLLAGTFLHDIGKKTEFVLGDTGLVTEYSLEGELLGHLVSGAEYVGRICRKYNVSDEKRLMLQHMLLSHHGEPEYGAAKTPVTMEAYLLSEIDAIDSRLEIMRQALEGVAPGAFSEKNASFGNRRLYKPTQVTQGKV